MRSHVSFHGCHTSCRVCASAWLSQAITNPVIGLGMECHASSDGIPTPAINIHQVKWKKVVHSVVNLFALTPNPSIYEEKWHISCHGKLLYMLLYMWLAKGMTGLHHVLYMCVSVWVFLSFWLSLSSAARNYYYRYYYRCFYYCCWLLLFSLWSFSS